MAYTHAECGLDVVYTTYMPLILPGDYWIIIVSIIIISLFVARKLIVVAYAGLGLTTAIIYAHYGSGRAVLHLFIMFGSVHALRMLSQKLATEEINDEN